MISRYDLLLSPEGARLGFEFKFTDNIRTTKSMRIAIEDLELKHLYIIHPGVRSYKIDANISALSISNLISTLTDIRRFSEN